MKTIHNSTLYRRVLKRQIDLFCSLVGIVIFAPFFIFVALLIKFDSLGPVFFKQKRLGKSGVSFEIWKFRTMCDNAENIGIGISTAEYDPRITKVGRVLRKLSIDELPQLFNIFLGEMSFIGPRPAPVNHIERYTKLDKVRLEVLPGLTGWAQVNGRNKLTWPEKIKKDIWYVENLTMMLDILILMKTIKLVFTLEGVYSGRNDAKLKNKTEKQ